MADKLDCGHPAAKTEGCGTGYGVKRNGSKHCYACCADDDRERMVADGHRILYVSNSGSGCPAEVTNWPGTLRFPVKRWSGSRGVGFGRWYQVTHVWFNGPDGFEWYGRNQGDQDLTRCKRTKTRVADGAYA